MKTIARAAIALTLVLGVVTLAQAFDPKTFWEENDKNAP